MRDGAGRRARILATVNAHPGQSFRGLVHLTGIPAGSLQHHILVLLRRRAVWYTWLRSRHAYFPGPRPAHEDAVTAALVSGLDDLDKALYCAVGQHGQAIQRQIIGWFPEVPRQTLQHRVRRLVAYRVLAERSQGRCKLYSLHVNARVRLSAQALAAPLRGPLAPPAAGAAGTAKNANAAVAASSLAGSQ